jgi:hypothetical protein
MAMCMVLLFSVCLAVATAADLDTTDDGDDGVMATGRKLLAKYKCGCRCLLPPAGACRGLPLPAPARRRCRHRCHRRCRRCWCCRHLPPATAGAANAPEALRALPLQVRSGQHSQQGYLL